MIDEHKCKQILLRIVKESTKDWAKKPIFEVVFDSLLCAIIVTVDKERKVQLASFKRAEIDDYLTGERYAVESKVKKNLLLLQQKFFTN